MSLERKDIRAKLDPDVHAALVVICEQKRLEVGEFIEREIESIVLRLIHEASVLAARTAHLGILGNGRDKPVKSGKNRE